MKNNQSGMTLVELLAVLVLISLVTGIIWTTMSISIKHNSVETTKLQLQQEANSIITKLQQIHRSKDCYNLVIEENEVSTTNCEDDTVFSETLGNQFKYGPITNTPYRPKEKNISKLELEVSDVRNDKISVVITTEISRYKSIPGGW